MAGDSRFLAAAVGGVAAILVLCTSAAPLVVPWERLWADPPQTPTARRAGPPPSEPPRQVRFPSGSTVPIRPAATGPDGLLHVPSDVRAAGWWTGGSRLGDPFGSMLLAGHVDSVAQGLGPYAEVLDLRRGSRIVVRSRSLEQRFLVSSLRLVPQDSLRRYARIHSVGGERRLTLVTCAPPYDARRGGYLKLAVVTAHPTGPPGPRHAP